MADVVADTAERLAAALRTVQGIRVYTDPGASVDPPGAVVAPPTLTWTAYCLTPTGAMFRVYLCAKASERAVDSLYRFLEPVALAVDEHAGGVVTRAEPGLFSAGGIELPAYVVTVEMEIEG